jgi:uncharacterized lipoprotein YajG
MRSLAVVWLALALLAGCADKQVTLNVGAPDLGRIPGAGALTVFPFADRRGSEGDQDPNRVGGVYGRYGNRVSKVTVATPFARTLADALAAAFKARGVEVVVAPAPSYPPGATPIATPFALAGELHDFSTEARFTTSAHVHGIVRLHARDGTLLYQREISERESEGIRLGGFFASTDRLQDVLNKALAKFVKIVADDPALSAALSRNDSRK